jgi:hypothetical protein
MSSHKSSGVGVWARTATRWPDKSATVQAIWSRSVRQDDRRDYTKHLIRLRHASQINGAEANEVILLNSHDGTSTYLMWISSVTVRRDLV